MLQRSEIGEAIEEHDEPVLAALQDIRYESARASGKESWARARTSSASFRTEDWIRLV